MQRDDERLIYNSESVSSSVATSDNIHHQLEQAQSTSMMLKHDEEMCTLLFFVGFLINIVWIITFVKYRNSESASCKKLALASIILFAISSVLVLGALGFVLFLALTFNPRLIA